MTNSLISKNELHRLINEPEIEDHNKSKKTIRKFMKQKKRKWKKEKNLEKSQEIKKHIKVKENLKILNKYVKHIRAQSSGIYYNRNSGLYEKRKNFSNKLYREYAKAKTPKYTDYNGFNFKKLSPKNEFTSDSNLKIKFKDDGHKINVDTSETPQSEFYLEYFKILTSKNKKRSRSGQPDDMKENKFNNEAHANKVSNEEMKGSLDLSQNNNRSQKSESNKKTKKHSKPKQPKPKTTFKRQQPMSRADLEIEHNLHMINTDDNMDDTMKKTLEENNKEREINLLTDNDSARFKNMTFKYASAPISNKNSDGHESIFSNSMKLVAYRASELKKKNKEFIKMYGNPKMVGNAKYEHEFLKILHSAALSIQDHWRDFILKKKSLNTEDRNEWLSSMKKLSDFDRPNNNRSSSNYPTGIPKLNLSSVSQKHDLSNNHPDGLFNHDTHLDLTTKRLQQLILNSDVPSMLKVREEGLIYKYEKEKSKIQKLLSSQKISPRTGTLKGEELEKWVDQERKDIDRTKQIYEENMQVRVKITEENKKLIEEIISDTQITQDQLKRIFSEKVITPREGHSMRSGFNSSRRLYELSQMNKQISSEVSPTGDIVDTRIKIGHDISADSFVDNLNDNIVFSDHDESKDKQNLKGKVENKFKRHPVDISDEFDNLNNKHSIELIDVFRRSKADQNKSQDDFMKLDSDYESPSGIIETENSKFHSRTPKLSEDKDDISPESLKRSSKFADSKDASRSLDIGDSFNKDNCYDNNEDENSGSISLIRIKSEHNLKENKDDKLIVGKNTKNQNKDKSYNSKNYFTEDFDNQDMDDAINKIKNNPDFDNSSHSRAENSNQNIELISEDQTISFDDHGLKDISDDPAKIAAIIESANVDYQKMVKAGTIKPQSNPILVNDNIFNDGSKDDLNEDSSISDHLDLGKTVDLKKDGFYDKLRQDKDFIKSKHDSISYKTSTKFEESKDNLTNNLSNLHSKSNNELIDNDDLLNPDFNPILGVDIERIGSPNKPKTEHPTEGLVKVGIKEELKDTRAKIDDEDDESIMSGSQTVNNLNSSSNNQSNNNGMAVAKQFKPDSMVDCLTVLKSFNSTQESGDIKLIIDSIIKSMIGELDEELFPKRPYLFTKNINDFPLDKAITLLNELTQEEQIMILDKISEPRIKSSSSHKKSKSSRSSDSSKLVLFEKKGIQTDLV